MSLPDGVLNKFATFGSIMSCYRPRSTDVLPYARLLRKEHLTCCNLEVFDRQLEPRERYISHGGDIREGKLKLELGSRSI